MVKVFEEPLHDKDNLRFGRVRFFESRRELLKEGIDFGHGSGHHTGHHP